MKQSEALAARERIFERGRSLGLSAMGVAPAERPQGASFFLDWLLREYHASMGYLSRSPEDRADPERILPGCRSVLCVALDYGGAEEDRAARDRDLGRISRYAWGDDYHLVLKEKLEALADSMRESWPEERLRIAVDTSPVLEKAFAARAGIGWPGKHTNLIDPKRGSWFFLGEIFSTLPLPPTDAIEDRCGTCARCIEICPTGAIVEPYVLDARLCLSYWNIEHRGEIAPEIAGRMDNWIFGCDLCQEVCPWNREAAERAEKRFAPRAENLGRPLAEWAGIGAEDFSRRFRDSAVKRARRDGFARNVGVALRNAGGGGQVS